MGLMAVIDKNQLRHQGWTVEEQPGHQFRLPAAVAARYPRLPDALVGFLSGLTHCVDRSETTWFLCQGDYDGSNDVAYRWDEWERCSLDAANGDARLMSRIRAFWDIHFPFLFSVQAGYAYHAVCTAGDRFGQVVAGREPEFEEVSVVADSFECFITDFIRGRRST